MTIPRLTISLLTLALLGSTLACSKKEEATPAPNTGSFQLDGNALSGQATATRDAGSIGPTRYDFLNLDLMPTATPTTGNITRLHLLFYKLPGSAATTYLLHNLEVYTRGNTAPYNFASQSFTLTTASDGSVSGSFAGTVSASSSMIAGPYTTITNGVFTAVRP